MFIDTDIVVLENLDDLLDLRKDHSELHYGAVGMNMAYPEEPRPFMRRQSWLTLASDAKCL